MRLATDNFACLIVERTGPYHTTQFSKTSKSKIDSHKWLFELVNWLEATERIGTVRDRVFELHTTEPTSSTHHTEVVRSTYINDRFFESEKRWSQTNLLITSMAFGDRSRSVEFVAGTFISWKSFVKTWNEFPNVIPPVLLEYLLTFSMPLNELRLLRNASYSFCSANM